MAQPSADGCALFVPIAQQRGSHLVVLELKDGAFRRTRIVDLKGAAVAGAALSPDGALLAVATGGVALLDTAALRAGGDPRAVEVPLDAGAGPIQLAFARDGALLFVSLERAGAVAVIDVAKARAGAGAAAVIGRVPQARAPVGLALSPDGARLYATSEVAGGALGGAARCRAEGPGGGALHPEGVLTVVDTRVAASDPAHAVVAIARAGCNPVRVAVSPDGARVWVTARGDDELLQFDAAALTGVAKAQPAARVKVGASPVGIAVRPDGQRLWVAASDRFGGAGAALIEVDVSGPKPRPLAPRPAEGFPRDLRYLPDGHTLAAALYQGQAVRIEP